MLMPGQLLPPPARCVCDLGCPGKASSTRVERRIGVVVREADTFEYQTSRRVGRHVKSTATAIAQEVLFSD